MKRLHLNIVSGLMCVLWVIMWFAKVLLTSFIFGNCRDYCEYSSRLLKEYRSNDFFDEIILLLSHYDH